MKTLNSYRVICLLCFIIPFLAINLCLVVYKISSNYKIYPDIDWTKKQIIINNIDRLNKVSFKNCPLNTIRTIYYYYNDGNKMGIGDFETNILLNKIKNKNLKKVEILINKDQENTKCIKKNNLINSFFIKFPFIEKKIVKSNLNNKSGYAKVKNPFKYGEISISRAARTQFNAQFIFKPFLIFTSILLILYWRKNNLYIKNLTSQKTKNYFFIFGIMSAILLIMHAIGIDYNQNSSKLIENIRRLILVLFIIAEIFAQFFLSLKIYQNRTQLIKVMHKGIMFSKMVFVIVISSFTLIILTYLAITKYEGNLINTIEWNFFNLLLLYYLLSGLLWKKNKTN